MLELDVSVERRELVVEVALEVHPGERVALFGPSGAGKTTVLETVAGFVAPRSGSVRLAGRTLVSAAPPRDTVPVWLRRVGLMRQEPALFPHLDVAGNLAYARAGGGSDPGARAAIAERLGIDGLLGAWPAALSGGQARRVALGRVLLADVDALLLDEPYAGLDARLRREVTEAVSSVVAARGIPAVLVAHELAEAQAFADRLGILDMGRLLQTGTPHEVVARPVSRRVAELVGYAAFVPAADRGTIGVHPARVVTGARPDEGVVITGALRAVRASGARFEADLDVHGVTVTCELRDPPAGVEVEVTVLDPPRFAPDGSARR
ncbi:MAG TPA: ATP-binding cassette domain-containing protein [Acidimicrobiales bacterium]|nr:ATP-binding cassette domain-containing protein [Acidimicrobiales bacterium]